MRLTGLFFAVTFAFAVGGCSKSTSDGVGPPPSSGAVTTSSTASQSSPPPFSRPPLQRQSGQYFTWLAPAGWTATESPNGVDLKSADSSILVNADLLRGNKGQSDPWSFTNKVLSAVGMKDIKQISAQNLPAQPSTIPGLSWTIQEFEITFTDATGAPRHADCTCAISSGYGGYDALFQGFSTTPDDFDKDKTWLPIVAGSVNAIDPSKVAYQNDVIPATNHPLDNSALMESWETRR